MPDPGEASFPSDRTALVTTHFGDPRWVELLLVRVRRAFPELSDDRIFVIDQDRTATSGEALRRRLGPVRILSYPISEPHIVMTGHDHAHVLNLAVREIDSDYVLVFDSDAHPTSEKVRPQLGALLDDNDAVLAAFDLNDTRTHPCFMLFGPTVDRERLRFDEGQVEVGVDTGRLVFDQVAAAGLRAKLLRPRPAFGGRWGTLYLDGTIYHHGSGSFGAAADPRLQAQAAHWRRESEFYRRRVFAGRYRLSPADSLAAAVLVAPRALVHGSHVARHGVLTRLRAVRSRARRGRSADR